MSNDIGQPCDTLIHNAYVITMDAERTVYPQGAVAIKRGEVVAVGSEKQVAAHFTGNRTIDAKGAALHPGFIETHVHITQHNFRFAFLGARALGWGDRVGSLEVGKKADLVIRRNDLPEMQPGLDPIRGIVFSARAKSIDTVILNGQSVVEQGHSTRADEDEIYEASRSAARNMLKRMGYSVERRWPHVE